MCMAHRTAPTPARTHVPHVHSSFDVGPGLHTCHLLACMHVLLGGGNWAATVALHCGRLRTTTVPGSAVSMERTALCTVPPSSRRSRLSLPASTNHWYGGCTLRITHSTESLTCPRFLINPPSPRLSIWLVLSRSFSTHTVPHGRRRPCRCQ